MAVNEETKLTPKREHFCKLYLIDWNATRAYIEAFGYDESKYHQAGQEAHRLLKKPQVKARIKKLTKNLDRKLEKRTLINKVGNLKRLDQVRNSNISDFFEFSNGKILLKNSKDIPKELMYAIKGIKETKNGIEIQLHDKVSSIKEINKMMGYYSENEQTDNNQKEDKQSIIIINGKEFSI